MGYKKKTYRKKRVSRRKAYRKKSSKGKRAASSMMSASRLHTESIALKQVSDISNATGGDNTIIPFGIAMLGVNQNFDMWISDFTSPNYQTFQVYAALYSEWCISGVSVKLIFRESSDFPINSWCVAYSENRRVVYNEEFQDQMMLLGNSQCGAVPANKVISRYFTTGAIRKRLGINMSSTQDATYYGQLENSQQPYIYGYIDTNQQTGEGRLIGTQIEITYYLKFRGRKGFRLISEQLKPQEGIFAKPTLI